MFASPIAAADYFYSRRCSRVFVEAAQRRCWRCSSVQLKLLQSPTLEAAQQPNWSLPAYPVEAPHQLCSSFLPVLLRLFPTEAGHPSHLPLCDQPRSTVSSASILAFTSLPAPTRVNSHRSLPSHIPAGEFSLLVNEKIMLVVIYCLLLDMHQSVQFCTERFLYLLLKHLTYDVIHVYFVLQQHPISTVYTHYCFCLLLHLHIN